MDHGAGDNNSATFFIQSERLLRALTGLGKNAVLHIYPFESHGPRYKEAALHVSSVTMGNSIAVKVWTRVGQKIVAF